MLKYCNIYFILFETNISCTSYCHFLRNIIAMRLTPQEALVRMPSGVPDNVEGRPLFIVHPIEGTVQELEDLSSLLPYKVFGFQCTEDVPLDSIQSSASYYLEVYSFIIT